MRSVQSYERLTRGATDTWTLCVASTESALLAEWNSCSSSHLGFSAAATMRLRKNSSLFFCMISSAVKPWLPFSTVFGAEGDVLLCSALTGSAAGAGEGLKLLSHQSCRTSSSDSTYPPFWHFYSSCHPVPFLCPRPLSQSLTSQFFGISQIP